MIILLIFIRVAITEYTKIKSRLTAFPKIQSVLNPPIRTNIGYVKMEHNAMNNFSYLYIIHNLLCYVGFPIHIFTLNLHKLQIGTR